MKSPINAVLLIAVALFSQGAVAQAEPVPGHERKAEVAGGNVTSNDGAKENARDDRAAAVRGTALSRQVPERSVAPGKNNTISLPQIPFDQLGLGCAE